jgi:hypothetical protein
MSWKAKGELEEEIMQEFIAQIEESELSKEMENTVKQFMKRSTFSPASNAPSKMAEQIIDSETVEPDE